MQGYPNCRWTSYAPDVYLDSRQPSWADAERTKAVKYVMTPQGPRIFVDAVEVLPDCEKRGNLDRPR